MGIEPTHLAWKASVLPLNYTRIIVLVGVAGFEPATSCSQSMRSTKLSYTPLLSFLLFLLITYYLLLKLKGSGVP